jgi:hypothetical protein
LRNAHKLFHPRTHLLSAAAAFVDGLYNLFPGLTGAFLDAADQFILLAFDVLEVVIGELREFLFQLALGNVPVSFGGKSSHIIFLFVFSARGVARREFPFARGVPKDLGNKSNTNSSIWCRSAFLLGTWTQRLCKLQIQPGAMVCKLHQFTLP